MDLQNKIFLIKDADLETKQNSILLNKDCYISSSLPRDTIFIPKTISDKRNTTYAKIPLQKSIA